MTEHDAMHESGGSTFIHCEFCRAAWPTDTAGLNEHESHCALRVDCGLCGSAPRQPCVDPRGRRAMPHTERERAARRAANEGER